jgi:hypothetical protein
MTAKNVTKLMLVIASLAVLVSCSGVSFNRLPDKFDSVEYRDLVEINILSKWSDTCASPELDRLDYLGRILATYSRGALNDDVAEIYAEIGSIAAELRSRENPSPAYCKLKRKNITEATAQAIEIFGRRLK